MKVSNLRVVLDLAVNLDPKCFISFYYYPASELTHVVIRFSYTYTFSLYLVGILNEKGWMVSDKEWSITV